MKKFLEENKVLVILVSVFLVLLIALGIYLGIKPSNNTPAGTADDTSKLTTVSPDGTTVPEGSVTTAAPSVSTGAVATTGEIVTRSPEQTTDGPHIVIGPEDSGTGTTDPSSGVTEVSQGETSEPGHVETQDPLCQHLRTQVRDIVSPTCSAEGYTGNTYCVDCGKVLATGNTVPTVAHTAVTVHGVAATCTSVGLTDGEKCSVCGKILTAQTQIPMKAHTSVNVPAVPATCQKTGTTAGTKCSVCGKVLSGCTGTDYAPHTAVTDPAVPATCGHDGKTAGSHCGVCGKVIVAQQTVPASSNAHDFSVVARVVPPQIGMPGYTIYKCSKCGAEDPNARNIVPMLEGDYAQQSLDDPSAQLNNVLPPTTPQPVPSIEIQGMSYDMHPDQTRDEDGFPINEIQHTVLIARDGTPIYGFWRYYGKSAESVDAGVGLPNPGWTFVVDFLPYQIGVSTYGWCYNRVYNTLVYGWWYWDSYGGGIFEPLDTLKGKTVVTLKCVYLGTMPDDACQVEYYRRGW